MRPALLDVNVLLALAWPNHQHHGPAHAWFAQESHGGWATIGSTQLAFIRLSSNPAYTPNAVSPSAAANLLKEWVATPHHRFWLTPPAAEPALFASAIGHQQVNDAYLVEVARANQGRLITFDRRLVPHDRGTGIVEVLATPA